MILCFREKLRMKSIINPYRKPTQVDEERILRPTGEALLRNSAKWPRKFARRGAWVKPGHRKVVGATVY